MIKRTIEISSHAAHVTVKHKQLVLKHDGVAVGSIPCEDVGVVLVDHPGTTYSHQALSSLAENHATLVLCGNDHLPLGILLPLGNHTQIVKRLHLQIDAKKPVKKRLWQQIVQAKIIAQSANLHATSPTRRHLEQLVPQVRSGDVSNVEARAAKAYWGAWLIDPPRETETLDFRRLRDGVAPNALLNYGYAVMRAAVARAIVAAGLHPALGIHHCHRSNAFCLADDLMEPLRPWVDGQVRELYFAGESEITQSTKQVLLELLATTVSIGGQQGPLMVTMHRYVASLVKCLEGSETQLEAPVLCSSADTDACGSS